MARQRAEKFLIIGMLSGMADNDYHILGQRMRMQPEAFTNQTFDPVAFMGAGNLPLGDNKPKTRAADAGNATPQNSEVAIATFPFRGIEYGVELARLRQPGRFGKKRSHAASRITRSNGDGPWHGDASKPDGRFWWPFGHGSHEYACA